MKAVTANRLDTGRVIYLAENGAWTDRLAKAALFDGEAADAALAEAAGRLTEVADIYLIEASADGAPAGREVVRETIRNEGPTVRPDLGKQAGNL